MSIEIDTSTVASSNSSESVQLIPCRIDHNGPAKVKDFFTTSVRTETVDEKEELHASFRGRPLHGKKIDLPQGYKGVILKETHKPFSEEEDRSFKVSHTFRSFTQWNLDLAPSAEDKIHKALDWMKIASVLHAPVDTEDDKENSD